MRTLFLVSVAFLIANPIVAQDGTHVMGYETYVVVAPIADGANALPFAELHCAKYNRFAHFRRMEGVKAIFDCDPRKPDKTPPERKGEGIY